MKADVSKPGTSTGPQVIDWVAFPGGELEGRRPDALCAACRRLRRERTGRDAAVCFQCYRERHRRERLFREASQRETTSEAQFQWTLPFEPVNTRRLESLKALRATERGGVTSFVDRRRRAQIAARHMLRMLDVMQNQATSSANRQRALVAAAHAAELQFPEAWLPFVVGGRS